MSVELLTKRNLEFLRLKRGCTGSSESTLVKMPHCWKSHVTAHVCFKFKLLCFLNYQSLNLIDQGFITVYEYRYLKYVAIVAICY